MSAAESILKRIQSPADELVEAIVNKRIGSGDAWDAMCKVADQHFQQGMQVEQSRQAFFDDHPIGKRLTSAYNAMPLDSLDKRLAKVMKSAGRPGEEHPPGERGISADTSDVDAGQVRNSSAAEIVRLARQHAAANPHMSPDACMMHVISMPNGKALLARSKKEDAALRKAAESGTKPAPFNDDDDDDGDDDFLGGPSDSIFVECLRQLALSASKEKQHMNKSPEEVVDHLIAHDPTSQRLARAAAAENLKANA